MPSASRFGIFKSRGHVAPVHIMTTSFSARKSSISISLPTCALGTNVCSRISWRYLVDVDHSALTTPSAAMRSRRRCTTDLSSFMLIQCQGSSCELAAQKTYLGMPYMRRPPMRSFRSYTVTRCPALFNWSAQANPAGPDPMIAILRPVRTVGTLGCIQPISKPCPQLSANGHA